MRYFLLLLSAFLWAQTKPVAIIKNKYDFQKSENSYNINNMFKALLESANFEVYFESEKIPAEYDICNLYEVNLEEKGSMFKTEMEASFKNCKKEIVYKTTMQQTREKDYQLAYLELMRLLQPEIVRFRPKIANSASKNAGQEKIKLINENKITKEEKGSLGERWSDVTKDYSIIYDQNGQKLIQIYKSRISDVYIAQKGNTKGIFYKKDNHWFFEYIENDLLKTEQID